MVKVEYSCDFWSFSWFFLLLIVVIYFIFNSILGIVTLVPLVWTVVLKVEFITQFVGFLGSSRSVSINTKWVNIDSQPQLQPETFQLKHTCTELEQFFPFQFASTMGWKSAMPRLVRQIEQSASEIRRRRQGLIARRRQVISHPI